MAAPLTRVGRGLVGFGVLAVGWEILGRAGPVDPEYLPPASRVLARLGTLLVDGDFPAQVLATVLAWLIALGAATAIAVPAGVVLGSVPGVRTATRALVEFLRPVPTVALIPLVIVLLGTGPETKIVLAVYAAVWPLLFNTVHALAEVDPVALDTARSFGLSRARTLAAVSLPHAAPLVVTGLRLSAAVALIVVVSTELLAGGDGGLGQVVFEAGSGGGGMDVVLAGTVVAGLLGWAANAGLEHVQRRWLGWESTGGPR